ncbi:rod shape-determining protein MreD [Bacillus shivajii]|uniref:rod shape-determining protein MreD n=1 Tax=Bacillus shivajii TaxID=1983719 RepID=UPI001CFA7B47|nr:rod shape-determining protein MreD [Bacillus shivajii]UCZ52087.1 rod shape-determining protein MreD [Bacillus shivajii]
MIRYTLFITLFFLFILEGTVYQIFAPDQFGFEYTIVPRWVFMLIIFAGIFRGRLVGTFYGIIFGFLYDVIFSSVLGVNTFAMGFIAYLFSISIPFFQKNLPIIVVTTMLAVTLLEYFVYGLMLLLGITEMLHHHFMYERFIPTMIMNFVVISIAAYPLRKGFYYLNHRLEE